MAVNVTGGSLEFEAKLEIGEFQAQLDRLTQKLENFTGVAEAQSEALSNVFTSAAGVIGGFLAIDKLGEFLGESVKVRAEFQNLEVVFLQFLKNKEQVDVLMKEVGEFAAASPFSLIEVAQASRKLLSFGLEASKLTGVLKSLGDISAGAGVPLTQLVTLFGKTKASGELAFRDLESIARSGVPIYEELAKVMKKPVDEIGNLAKIGKIGFPELEQAFKNLTEEGSKFGGIMELQSKTLGGQLKSLKEAVEDLFNDVGTAGQGAFGQIIQAATYMVRNYKEIIKILEVLIITYGAYKAALIAEVAISAIAAASANGLTLAMTLQYYATVLAQKAMALLNVTILKNPVAFLVAGLAALVTALILFSRRATEAKSKAELLANAQESIGDKMAETQAKIAPYTEELKRANLTEADRVRIFNELLKLDPKIVEGLDARSLSYEKLQGNVDLYLIALRKQYALEANEDALKASIRQERLIADRIKQKEQYIDQLDKRAATQNSQNTTTGINATADQAKQERALLGNLKQDLTDQENTSKKFANETIDDRKEINKGIKRTIEIIDQELAQARKKQIEQSGNHAEYLKNQQEIDRLEAEKLKITGASKKDIAAGIRAENQLEKERNKLLEARISLQEKISDLLDQSRQSGQTKQLTELDKINERYDDLILSVEKYNRQVDIYNAKNKKNPVNKVGQSDIVEINNARANELDNQRLKEDADRYKIDLDDKKRIFAQYEDAKKEIGIRKSKEMFDAQTQGFDTYLSYLNSEIVQLLPKIQFGIANVGEVEKFQALVDQITKYKRDKAEQDFKDEQDRYKELLIISATAAQKEFEINKYYDDQLKELGKNATIEEYNERYRIIEEKRAEDLDLLKNDLARASALYKKLNQDILLFTRERLKEEAKLLQKRLKTDTTLTPQQRADIQATINQYKGLLNDTNEVATEFGKLASNLSAISGIFSNLANGVRALNSGLADTLDLMSDMAAVAADAAGSVASFVSGDIVGGITQGISAISKLLESFGKVKESKIKTQQDILDFQQKTLIGEQEYNALLRERARQQILLNKLTLQGLSDQKALLEQQKQAAISSYNDILAKLQNESFVGSVTTKKKRGSLLGGLVGFFAGTRYSVEENLVSLAGKSFAEIEKLFLQGQLTDKAKELFEQLKKAQQEGVDIDALLAENAQKFKEALTGTNASSIVDSIVQGFAQGKKSAADFAGTFQDLMKQALLQSLQLKYLEGPLTDFFNEFASLTESDGQLTGGEITALQTQYNAIIDNAAAQFQQLQQVAGLNFSGGSAGSNSLAGAIKGITEQQAELLAGQFGGLRITALENLGVSRSQLTALNAIQLNTGTQVQKTTQLLERLQYYYEVKGIKIL